MNRVTNNGVIFSISDEDIELVDGHDWYADRRPNGKTYIKTKLEGKTIYLHRMLLGTSQCRLVDHRDNNGTNNLRSNLRVATPRQNAQATHISKTGRRFKGVSLAHDRRWLARICIPCKAGSKQISRGRHASEELAAHAYDVAALFYFGLFAVTNFPRSDYEDGRWARFFKLGHKRGRTRVRHGQFQLPFEMGLP